MGVALRRAIDEPGLAESQPGALNRESPISRLVDGLITPNPDFYVRSHHPAPAIDPHRWRLRVGGLVRQPLLLGLDDLLDAPKESLDVTLECAGNGRSRLLPAVAGEQWGLGAVSTARWTGVPLAEILERAGPRSGALEVVLTGADVPADASPSVPRFQRSLPLVETRNSSILLAYAMNGEPLPRPHGYPLRAVVPNWYAVASVKWLIDIQVVDSPFRGYFQVDKYVYRWERAGRSLTEPVRYQRVRALITEPADGQTVQIGKLRVAGVAWSGVAPIARVEVNLNGQAWRRARMLGVPRSHAWQRWDLVGQLERKGRTVIRARATDAAGRTQPVQGEWNRLGYGNNAIQEVVVQTR